MGEWRSVRRRALPYENNAHSYRLTAANLAQSKINMPSLSDWVGYIGQSHFTRCSGPGLAPIWEDQRMSSEVPIEIEDKPTAVSIMRELVEHLQDTIEALKREI